MPASRAREGILRRILSRLGVDGVAALILIALCGFGFLEISGYPARAAIWPHWMLVTLLVLSLALLIQALLRGPRPVEADVPGVAPDAGTPDAGTPDAGTPESSPDDRGQTSGNGTPRRDSR